MCSIRAWSGGGADAIRTRDFHDAIVALYQLSYSPRRRSHCNRRDSENGHTRFLTSSYGSNTKNAQRDYVGEVDAFGVYSPERNLAYLVPASGLPKGYGSLRVAPTRNGQRQGVWWADDYLLGPHSVPPFSD
jgi:hypothetical protein